MRSLYGRLHRRFGTRPTGKERVRRTRQAVARLHDRFKLDRWVKAYGGQPCGAGLKVAIVGGGFGGLSAGFLLSQAGVSVMVYEASDRLGGRVWSQPTFTTGRVIEWGGELIGFNHPAWISLAEKLGIGLSMLTSEDDYAACRLDMPLLIGGHVLSDDEQEVVNDDMTAAFKVMNADAGTIPDPYAPWEAPTAPAFDKISLGAVLDKQSYKSPYSRGALEAQFANNNGAATSKQSYLANLALVQGAAQSYEDPDGMSFWNDTEVARCSGGNMALANALGNAIGQSFVQTGHPVSAINLLGPKPVVEVQGLPDDVCDAVILAVPPSAWGTHISITPAIPPDYYMPMGTVVKYLTNVKSRFWLTGRQAPSGMSDAIGMLWEGTDNQIGGSGYELSLFAGGPAAANAIAGGGGQNYYTSRIDALYPGYAAAFGNSHFMNWNAQQYIYGGYSCPNVGDVTRRGPLLNAPFKKLYFAGEHVCMAYFGFMEGALESGILAAIRVLADFGRKPLGARDLAP